MKAQQRIDKILEVINERVQDEVGGLMGVDFNMSEIVAELTSKEDYLTEQAGKKVIARMDVTGDVEGFGGLVLSVKDAIRLGGTLIMLPQSELEEVVTQEDYSEEIEDSYGEIANIIAGAYTKVFEDMFPQNCRFVRKEQEAVAPLKLEIEADEPFPNQWYYVAKSSMSLDGTAMGEMDMLIPAEAFGIEVPEITSGTDAAAVEAGESNEEKGSEQSPVTSPELEEGGTSAPSVEQTAAQGEVNAPGGSSDNEDSASEVETAQHESPPCFSEKDLAKHKKLVDNLLKSSNQTLADEVGALLGVEVSLSDITLKPVTKEDLFLDELSGKQVLAHMDVVDGVEGNSYLFVNLKDAIRIGSILIMLPPSELESAVNDEDFSVDAEDAYGEIANIISGAYTNYFQDQYTKSIRFIKTDLEVVSPMKVDLDSGDVVSSTAFYLNSSTINIDGKQFGKISMAIPLELLELSQLMETESQKNGEQDQQSQQEAGTTHETPSGIHQGQSADTAIAAGSGKSSAVSPGSGQASHSAMDSGEYEILVIENSPQEAQNIAELINQMGMTTKTISFSDNIDLHLSSHLRLVVIVMQEVDEQAYGVTIKVHSNSSVPIVAAGSMWTRTKVIKAVKYGVTDILLTPAQGEEIQEKVQNNIVQLAA